jgi:DNA-binding LacI/PurR family transcriptional regulator
MDSRIFGKGGFGGWPQGFGGLLPCGCCVGGVDVRLMPVGSCNGITQNMKHPIPQRISLVDQTAEALRALIGRREFAERLPGEIELAAKLHVGRNTLRVALAVLEEEGWLRKVNGMRREIVKRRLPARSNVRRAILLTARPKHELSPSTARWIEELISRMEGSGWEIHLQVEPGAYRGRPSQVLESLTRSWPGAVWILHHSTPAMQRWFQGGGTKTILAGSRHEGITLPRVESDLRAASRHAAGRFLARGHRRLAVLRPDAPLAGDEESVAAFREGAGAATVTDVRCHRSAAGVVTAVRALLRSPNAPTGIYVLHPEHCVTVLTFLQQQGVAVPGRVSLICREDEAYLGLLCPEPTRYRRSAKAYASKLAALVEQAAKGPPDMEKEYLIMPSSIAGETLAAAPVPKGNR